MNPASSFSRDYIEARLDRNRALAERTQDPVIRTLHLEYVRLYENMLQQQGGGPVAVR